MIWRHRKSGYLWIDSWFMILPDFLPRLVDHQINSRGLHTFRLHYVVDTPSVNELCSYVVSVALLASLALHVYSEDETRARHKN